MAEKGLNTLTAGLLVVIIASAVLGVAVTVINPDFVFELQPGVRQDEQPYLPGGLVYEAIYIILTMATNILYLVGGGLVFFGAVLVTVRFLQTDPEDPHKVHEVTRHLSGYLNMGLAFFIGAEIIKTVVVRTTAEFTLLVFIIVSRGIFSLILYLERRWHGTENE